MQRRLISGFIVFLMVNVLLMGSWLDLGRRIIKEQVEEQIKEGVSAYLTHRIFYSTTDFAQIKWEENLKEFYYQGQMFDVMSIKQVKDGYQITCLNDSDETALVDAYAALQGREPLGSVVKVWLDGLTYDLPPSEMPSQFIKSNVVVEQNGDYVFSIMDWQTTVETKPPMI